MITAADIRQRLHERYPFPKWAAFDELRDAAGFGARSTCDFFAMHTWPSKAFLRVAVEIKVSRGDFLRELDNPGKRAQFEAWAHEFYFAAPARLIKPEEVPEGCGLLEATHKTLRARVRAKQRDPEDFDTSFVATLLRASAEARQKVLQSQEQFAEFAGRPVTLNDLRRIADKFGKRDAYWLQQQAREEVARERRENAKNGSDIQSWWRSVRLLREVAGKAVGRKWNDPELTPEQVEEWLRALPHSKLGELARRMRDLAADILPSGAVDELGRGTG